MSVALAVPRIPVVAALSNPGEAVLAEVGMSNRSAFVWVVAVPWVNGLVVV